MDINTDYLDASYWLDPDDNFKSAAHRARYTTFCYDLYINSLLPGDYEEWVLEAFCRLISNNQDCYKLAALQISEIDEDQSTVGSIAVPCIDAMLKATQNLRPAPPAPLLPHLETVQSAHYASRSSQFESTIMGVLPKANPTAQAKLKLAQAVFDDVGGYDELTPHRAQELLNDIFPDETFDLPEDGAGAKHGALSGGGRFITVAYTYLQALLGQAPDSPPKAPRPPEAPKQQGPLSALFSSLTSVIPSAPRPLSPPGPQLPIADEAQGTDSDVSQTGLKNLINTCYANGALQGLAGCEEFMRLARTELETLPDATSPKQLPDSPVKIKNFPARAVPCRDALLAAAGSNLNREGSDEAIAALEASLLDHGFEYLFTRPSFGDFIIRNARIEHKFTRSSKSQAFQELPDGSIRIDPQRLGGSYQPFRADYLWDFLMLQVADSCFWLFDKNVFSDQVFLSRHPFIVPAATATRFKVTFDEDGDWIRALMAIIDNNPGPRRKRPSRATEEDDIEERYRLDEEAVQEDIEQIRQDAENPFEEEGFRWVPARLPETYRLIQAQCCERGRGLLLPLSAWSPRGEYMYLDHIYTRKQYETYRRTGRLPMEPKDFCWSTGSAACVVLHFAPMAIRAGEQPYVHRSWRLRKTWSLGKNFLIVGRFDAGSMLNAHPKDTYNAFLVPSGHMNSMLRDKEEDSVHTMYAGTTFNGLHRGWSYAVEPEKLLEILDEILRTAGRQLKLGSDQFRDPEDEESLRITFDAAPYITTVADVLQSEVDDWERPEKGGRANYANLGFIPRVT